MLKVLEPCLRTCRRVGVRPTRWLLAVNIRRQSMLLCERIDGCYVPRRDYRISTSRFGIGSRADSNCTPLGLHRVAKKVGGGQPIGAVFKSRKLKGFTWTGLAKAPITHRIFWLEGMEPGKNRGGQVDTFARYIYIHGTGDEPSIGRPASHGCIHVAAKDLISLYDFLPEKTLVWISER
jgi:L,D-transpeptidase YbiS